MAARTRRARDSKANTRARVLAAARDVFLRRGFQATSIEEIAGEAGYTIGAIYSSFATKGDLFVAVFEEQVADRVHEIEEAVAEAPDSEGEVQRATEQFMEKLADDPAWFTLFIELWVQAARDPELRQRFALPFGAIRLTVGRLVARHAAQGGLELPISADDIGLAVKALANGIALEKVVDPEGVRDDLFGAVLTILVRGLAAEPSHTTDARMRDPSR